MKSKVIEALSMSSVPALQGCSLSFIGIAAGYTEGTVKLGSIFRNKIVRHFTIMSDKEFKALKVSLIVNFDPATKKSQSMKIQNF